MGYSTDFYGSFKLNKPLDEETKTFLTKLAQTRRMKRDVSILLISGLAKMTDDLGVDGEFFVDGGGFMGQDNDPSVVNHNAPPATQPGLWCQWIPNEDGTEIEWDGGEKFYDAQKWLEYIIDRVLAPKGYILNGVVDAYGEEHDDIWQLMVSDNEVLRYDGHIEYIRAD